MAWQDRLDASAGLPRAENLILSASIPSFRVVIMPKGYGVGPFLIFRDV